MDEADEDSNGEFHSFFYESLLICRMVAEDFYKNDYPDEEESSSGTCADMMFGAPS